MIRNCRAQKPDFYPALQEKALSRLSGSQGSARDRADTGCLQRRTGNGADTRGLPLQAPCRQTAYTASKYRNCHDRYLNPPDVCLQPAARPAMHPACRACASPSYSGLTAREHRYRRYAQNLRHAACARVPAACIPAPGRENPAAQPQPLRAKNRSKISASGSGFILTATPPAASSGEPGAALGAQSRYACQGKHAHNIQIITFKRK